MNGYANARKTDLRVVKTREAIRLAFERLLETTEYGSITVSAIAREAQVSRKTFYAHYASVDELLRQMALDVVKHVASETQPKGELLEIEEWIAEFTHRFVATLQSNPHLNGNVVRCVPTLELLGMLKEPLFDICSSELSKRGLVLEPIHGYYLLYHLGGLSSVYEAWLRSSQDAAALDDIAQRIARVTWHGIGDELMEN